LGSRLPPCARYQANIFWLSRQRSIGVSAIHSRHSSERSSNIQPEFIRLGLRSRKVEAIQIHNFVPGAPGRVKLILPDGLEVRRLYQVAAEQNVQIRRLSHKRDSLEDIFLKAMEVATADGRL